MAGYENIRDANEKRTPEERRELAKKAGKASGQARRRKADLDHLDQIQQNMLRRINLL